VLTRSFAFYYYLFLSRVRDGRPAADVRGRETGIFIMP